MYVCRLVSTCHCLWITPQARCSASSRTLCSLGSCWGSEGTRNKTRTSWSDVRSNSNLQRCCDRGWVCMYVCVCARTRAPTPFFMATFCLSECVFSEDSGQKQNCSCCSQLIFMFFFLCYLAPWWQQTHLTDTSIYFVWNKLLIILIINFFIFWFCFMS